MTGPCKQCCNIKPIFNHVIIVSIPYKEQTLQYFSFLKRKLPELREGGEETIFLDLFVRLLFMGPCTVIRQGSMKPQVLVYLGIFQIKNINSYFCRQPFLNQNTGFLFCFILCLTCHVPSDEHSEDQEVCEAGEKA